MTERGELTVDVLWECPNTRSVGKATVLKLQVVRFNDAEPKLQLRAFYTKSDGIERPGMLQAYTRQDYENQKRWDAEITRALAGERVTS